MKNEDLNLNGRGIKVLYLVGFKAIFFFLLQNAGVVQHCSEQLIYLKPTVHVAYLIKIKK